jgi:hypothetical protein
LGCHVPLYSEDENKNTKASPDGNGDKNENNDRVGYAGDYKFVTRSLGALSRGSEAGFIQ